MQLARKKKLINQSLLEMNKESLISFYKRDHRNASIVDYQLAFWYNTSFI